MLVINARNVHDALPRGILLLKEHGQVRDSRNGAVYVAPCPVATVYEYPLERVMFWPQRDCNPFLHLYESLWMLAGRSDVAPLARIAGNMVNYSDDGVHLHGAYGRRWTRWFVPQDVPDTSARIDQLRTIAHALRENPDCRRQVLQMWDAPHDLGRAGKDVPCNTHVYFTRDIAGNLDMTVCCRSNDMVWGAYGANAVHFSYLQEYMAALINCPVGKYTQFSNNFHGYLKTMEPLGQLIAKTRTYKTATMAPNPYSEARVYPVPLVGSYTEQWRQELHMFMDQGHTALGYKTPFFRRVALPMLRAFEAWKDRDAGDQRFDVALDELRSCIATDWRLAAEEWLLRRRARQQGDIA